MDITVRRLAQGDETTLATVVLRHKARTIDIGYAGELLMNPLNFLLVAESQTRALGFVWGYLLPRLDRQNHQLFVYEVDVSPEARGQGVGTALMNFVADYTKAHHLVEAFVLADPGNTAAKPSIKAPGQRKWNHLPPCFCITVARPDDSFKPTQLRGTRFKH